MPKNVRPLRSVAVRPAKPAEGEGSPNREGHEAFQLFLADALPEDLPALGHLASCPLCREVVRLVLGSAISDGASGHRGSRPGSGPAERRRRRRR
jgi:hypothetical protein